MTDPRARPTLYVPLIGIPALLIFFGGGIALGGAHARAAENVVPGVVPATELADPNRVPNGGYVETVGELERYRHGVAVKDAPEIAVDRAPVIDGPRRFTGRVCDVARPPIGCDIPKDPPPRATRWLLVGASPERSRDAMLRAYGVAAFACVVYLAFVVYSRRRRKGPARVAEERTWTVQSSAEDVAGAIRTLQGSDRFQIVAEGPGHVAFIQGYSENAARGWGIRRADVFPRRATVTWKSSPREPARVTARVEEDLLWWPSPLTPTMHALACESIATTMSGIERALGISA